MRWSVGADSPLFPGIMAAVTGLAPLAAEDVQIAGSTTCQPVMTIIAKAYQDAHPDVAITVKGGGTENGIKLTTNGKIDIGMASRALNDADHTANPDLVATTIANDGLVFIAPDAVTVTAVTSDQVRDIYTGITTTWKTLGGNDQTIVPIGVDQSHGSAKVFDAYFKLEATEEFIGAAPMIHERIAGSATPGSVFVQVAAESKSAVDAVASHAGSIGYCSAAIAEAAIAKGAHLRILSLDGVVGTSANITSGTYALRRPLLLLTKGPAQGRAKDIIDFALSPDGQRILEQAEFIPVATADATAGAAK